MDEKMSKKIDFAMLAVGAVVILIFAWQYFQSAGTPAEVKPEEQPAPSADSAPAGEYPEYAALQGMRSVELAKGFESWTPEAKVDPEKTRTASLTITGNVSEAFLLVKAGREGQPFSQWESFYFKLNDAGGHVFRPQSLKTPVSIITSLLFNLYDLPYLPTVPYSEEREPERANLLAMLKPGARLYLTTFISSLRPGSIEELTLYYACVEGSDCSIAIQ